MKSKKIIFISIILVIIVIVFIFCVIVNQKSYNINEITNNRIENVNYVTNQDYKKIDIEIVKNGFDSYYFKLYDGSLGNTAWYKYYFYDDKDSCLFTIVDVGNKGLLLVNMGEKNETYQAYKIK